METLWTFYQKIYLSMFWFLKQQNKFPPNCPGDDDNDDDDDDNNRLAKDHLYGTLSA